MPAPASEPVSSHQGTSTQGQSWEDPSDSSEMTARRSSLEATVISVHFALLLTVILEALVLPLTFPDH